MKGRANPRCAVVGPGRRRVGLGPFLVRDLEAAGVPVIAVAGRDLARTRADADALEARVGHPIAAYDAVADMLAAERPAALVIASPIESHLDALRAALAAGVHVLCEKPLVAPGQQAVVPALLDAFEQRGLLLMENCQWPYALREAPGLLPDPAAAPPGRVEMRLSPVGVGRAMLVDSLSHFLSVLQTLLPIDAAAGVDDVGFSDRDPAADRCQVEFGLHGTFAPVQATLYLARCPEPPRPAWIAVDGRRIERRIRMDDYGMSLQGEDGRSVAIGDPLTALVTAFATTLREPHVERVRAESAAIRERARLFHDIVEAWHR